MSGTPTGSRSSSLTWGCSSKYIWLRSEVSPAQCLMTAFIFWARSLCRSCLTVCTCPVFCYMINTLVRESAACCVCGSHADKLILLCVIISRSADRPSTRQDLLQGQFLISHPDSHSWLCDLYWPLKYRNHRKTDMAFPQTTFPLPFHPTAVFCNQQKQSHTVEFISYHCINKQSS